MTKITVTTFKNRLTTLCLKKGGRGLPRKPTDRHILFKSIVLTLDARATYTETNLNQVLIEWLESVGQLIEIDHVTLRRHLVDEGYLARDPAGTSYSVLPAAGADRFEPAIDALDPLVVIEEARRQQEEKKRAYLDKRED